MMKFSEMPYKRLTYEEIHARYEKMNLELEQAKSTEDCLKVLHDRYQMYNDMTVMNLCYIRHDMDTNDAFYAGEQAYYDEIGPKLSADYSRFDNLLLDSPFRKELEEVLGHAYFVILETTRNSYDSRLIPLSQEENRLIGRYNALTSNATVHFQGEEVNRNRMFAKTKSSDRAERKAAALAISASWEAQKTELEDIYHQLVQNRHQQARILGYDNYVGLGYRNMYRIGYGPAEVTRFRDYVKTYIVPLWVKLEEQRRKRIGLDHLYAYDGGISFPEGNPIPLGDTQWCLERTKELYEKLSPETAEFIDRFMEDELYDVEMRDGKRTGGYMYFLEGYRMPFIYANFDGTSENAYIMCHEGGHAFQSYLKRDEEIRERCQLTSEVAETHAMSMEFFTHPYMELFFGDRADDYRTMHFEGAIFRICYQCQQDEFQQLVYEHPDMTPDERNALWIRLDREYFPTKDLTGNDNLLAGRGWQRIPHAFLWPFYAIDYGLAQVCALEYYQWMNQDFDAAWKSYLQLCRETGTKSFPELVKSAGLGDPFSEDTFRSLAAWLTKAFSL
jgi:M3 family oligoendopeptidase